jgi:hypothetical protein
VIENGKYIYCNLCNKLCYIYIGKCIKCKYNKKSSHVLNDWIKPFVDSINKRFKQCGKQ